MQKKAGFIGRVEEGKILLDLFEAAKPSIAIVYGRRRVGKTALIEHFFRDKKLYKFEGLEGETAQGQREHFLRQLLEYQNQSFHVRPIVRT